MVVVRYEHELPYGASAGGRLFPRLLLRLSNPSDPAQSLDVDAYLDSGAERSLFDGRLGRALGIAIENGARLTYATTFGATVSAWLHRVKFEHEELGDFDLEVGFSSQEVHRNLLGRDFFRLVQVGFREHHGVLYITPTP